MRSGLHGTQISKYQLIDDIKVGECQEYFFGIHGISIENFKEYVLPKNKDKYKHITNSDQIYKNILNEGLLVPYGIATSTIHNLGLGKNFQKTTLNYQFPESDEIFNVLVAVPPYMTIGNKKYFVGDLSSEFNEQRNIFLHTILTVCILNKSIPSEYIYGSYKTDKENNETILFHKNPMHVSLMEHDKQQGLFEKLLNEAKIELEVLDMIMTERITPTVDKTTPLVRNRNYITMYNTVCNTINTKRIYENQNIPKEAIKKLIKRRTQNI